MVRRLYCESTNGSKNGFASSSNGVQVRSGVALCYPTWQAGCLFLRNLLTVVAVFNQMCRPTSSVASSRSDPRQCATVSSK